MPPCYLISRLNSSVEKYSELLDTVKALDDSGWDRHTLTSELASALKKLENARLRFIMLSSAMTVRGKSKTDNSVSSAPGKSFIHELNSLSFRQCCRMGFAFFLPLILGILFSVLLYGIIYYISIHNLE